MMIGCAPQSDIHRTIVIGKVTFDGKPIKNGQILFVPMSGTAGPISVARIQNGSYEATARGGVPVGQHRVQVEAYRAAAPSSDPDSGVGRAQYLPNKYNHASNLTVEIVSGTPLIKDFHLEP